MHDLHKTAASIAGIDLNLLRIEGKLVAWSYNYRCDGRIEVQRLRAAGELATAAETVLVGRMLCDGFRRGDDTYLFDRQSSRTAAGWQTGRANSYLRVQYPRQGGAVSPDPGRCVHSLAILPLDRHRPFWRACFELFFCELSSKFSREKSDAALPAKRSTPFCIVISPTSLLSCRFTVPAN